MGLFKWLFSGATTQPTAQSSQARVAEYASIEDNGRYHSLSSQDVDDLFRGLKEQLKSHKKSARQLMKLAEKFEETGKLDEQSYSTFADLEEKISRASDAAEKIYDSLFFAKESSQDKHYKLIDELSEVLSDVEHAHMCISHVKEDIASGDFQPQKKSKQPEAKRYKRPPDGTSPDLQMLYRSMGGKEGTWRVLVLEVTGENTFVAWSFEQDMALNFNAVGVLIAKDLKSGKKITSFVDYLRERRDRK
ncbi:hypothetical protein [Shinella sp.]|uniref:hypothetical protein n=1 Tax=Shinella sp. TaxID=1870904 RepID=UPI00289FAA30|nr:hypothetical protein [Shinella sp.]